MKYMGSKRSMLANGLGEILRNHAESSAGFADLFAGSGAVAWYVGENTSCRVIAADLQLFAVSLAEAVITRRGAIDAGRLWEGWYKQAQPRLRRMPLFREAELFSGVAWERARRQSVDQARGMCAEGRGVVTRAYGGYYFSPKQALLLDALRETLPRDPTTRRVALAALIWAASECAASPGHTAQPFHPTRTASPFLFEAWRRDVVTHVRSALQSIAPRCARVAGQGTVCDAEVLAGSLSSGDVAFVDPPYSDVHYSRFYHVLETIARGQCGHVEGAGRYPAQARRPRSEFSMRSKAPGALERLLGKLAERGVRTVLTFPEEQTSNGLSGSMVESAAKRYFRVSRVVVNGRFSTLGGNSENRKARIPAYEIILTLAPRT